MKKSGTTTKSTKATTKTQTVKQETKPQNLTQEEKELAIKLIEAAAYYNDYMLTDFDRNVIKDLKRKILK